MAEYSNKRINALEINAETYIGVDNLLPDCGGKTVSNYAPKIGTLTRFEMFDILVGNIRPYLKKIWFSDCVGGTNGDVLAIHRTYDGINPKYLYHVLSSDDFFNYDMQNAKGAKMPRGDKNKVMNYIIPLPPLPEQERIVAILDRFEALCNDLQAGLPAEIKSRQQQYEYYRDKLLSFEPL